MFPDKLFTIFLEALRKARQVLSFLSNIESLIDKKWGKPAGHSTDPLRSVRLSQHLLSGLIKSFNNYRIDTIFQHIQTNVLGFSGRSLKSKAGFSNSHQRIKFYAQETGDPAGYTIGPLRTIPSLWKLIHVLEKNRRPIIRGYWGRRCFQN